MILGNLVNRERQIFSKVLAGRTMEMTKGQELALLGLALQGTVMGCLQNTKRSLQYD